ncbi:hypothetical protein MMC30_007351 [Trapelia coarctata]|nr:hypothetical protein [Trapelia coarctata]
MLFVSDAFTLKIRQGPERARVTGAKEKGKPPLLERVSLVGLCRSSSPDRKPVDPPPIIQLFVRDANDPGQNYLQSPYFFMCCNLWDPVEEKAAQTDSQSVLAGTLVSSLHRLKDVDNTDGGFFVFGDLSVKIEGEFRLRFSLFEMFQTEVMYIKSIVSDVFTVHAAKSFPGMSESTFLSRSFGDQGVRLRIRKETRTLLKRPPPPSIRPEDFSQSFPPANLRQDPSNTSSQLQFVQNPGYGLPSNRDYSSEYHQSPNKRQRTSVSNGSASYDRDPYNQRSYPQAQNAYGVFPGQNQALSNNPSDFAQAQMSTPNAMPDFTFRYSLPESSSAMSSFVSPRAQMPSFGSSGQQTQQIPYQQHGRYGTPNYGQSQFGDVQTGSMPRLAQPVAVNRHSNPIDQLQTNTAVTFTGMPSQDQQTGSRRASANVRDEFYQYSQQLQSPDQSMRAPPQPQDRYNMPGSSPSNLLPPLQSTVSNVQNLQATSSAYSNYIAPDSRLPSQSMPLPTSHDFQEKFTGYTHNVDLEGRRNLHEPG